MVNSKTETEVMRSLINVGHYDYVGCEDMGDYIESNYYDMENDLHVSISIVNDSLFNIDVFNQNFVQVYSMPVNSIEEIVNNLKKVAQ